MSQLLAAYLEVCSMCQLHGRMFFRDGSRTGECKSQFSAFRAAGEALQENKLSEIEMTALFDDIFKSPLPLMVKEDVPSHDLNTDGRVITNNF